MAGKLGIAPDVLQMMMAAIVTYSDFISIVAPGAQNSWNSIHDVNTININSGIGNSVEMCYENYYGNVKNENAEETGAGKDDMNVEKCL